MSSNHIYSKSLYEAMSKKCVNDDVKSIVKTMDDNRQMELSNIDNNEEVENGDQESKNNNDDHYNKIQVPAVFGTEFRM